MHLEDRNSDGFLDTELQIDALPCLGKPVPAKCSGGEVC